jgi:AraC-like DNA-binding protein
MRSETHDVPFIADAMITEPRAYDAHAHATMQVSLVEAAAPAWLHVESPDGARMSQPIPGEPVIVCIPAGQPHATTWHAPTALATMQVPATEVDRITREWRLPPLVTATVAVAPGARAYAHAWSLPPALRPLALSAILPEVLLAGYGAHHAATGPGGEHLTGRQIGTVVELLSSRLAAPVTIGVIAAALRMSDAHFARSFRRTIGVSPYQFLLRWRAAHAEDLIAHTDLPLREVALLSGHADQSHLTHRLRATTGRTPGQIRRNSQESTIPAGAHDSSLSRRHGARRTRP